jgi:hypothetical protein
MGCTSPAQSENPCTNKQEPEIFNMFASLLKTAGILSEVMAAFINMQ